MSFSDASKEKFLTPVTVVAMVATGAFVLFLLSGDRRIDVWEITADKGQLDLVKLWAKSKKEASSMAKKLKSKGLKILSVVKTDGYASDVEKSRKQLAA